MRRRPRATWRRAAAWLVCAVLLVVASARDAFAQPGASPPECPAGNLLRLATQTENPLAGDKWALLTDGSVAPEGAPWPSDAVLAVLRQRLSFDLGRTIAVHQLFLQADADQKIMLELSADGATWTRLEVPPHETASGMLSRSTRLPGLATRYVRVSSPDPGAPVTLSELGLYCERVEKLRRSLVVVGAHGDANPDSFSRWTRAHPVSPAEDDVIKLVVVLCAALWVVVHRRKQGRLLDGVLGLLGVVAALAYTNFGSYRYPDFLHEHDVFHYFVGAKYFPELGYDGLYACAAVAESDAGFRQRVELRAQRDLRTNRLVSGAEILSLAGECRARFTPARWRAFASDVEYFADGRTVDDWHRILKDHGFNASPTWVAFGAAVARPLPATASTIGRGDSLFGGIVGPLDPLLLLGAFGAIAWAFGFRAAAIVAIVFGCNPLSEYSWVGGGFLRELWIATLVVGVCLLRKEHFALGGATLCLSALLQLFPGACLFAIFAAAGVGFVTERALDRRAIRVFSGALAALVVLVPLSTIMVGRGDAWFVFATNTEKHAATPSGNLVGLPTALSFRMSTRASLLFDESAVDPFARVREARRENLGHLRVLRWLGVGLGLFGLYRSVRARPPPWFSAVLGLTLVPLFIETSCYYAAWLAPLALVFAQHSELSLPLFGVLATSLCLVLGVNELDVSSAFASFALVAGAFAVLAIAARAPAQA